MKVFNNVHDRSIANDIPEKGQSVKKIKLGYNNNATI